MINNRKMNLKGKSRKEIINTYAKLSKIFNDVLENKNAKNKETNKKNN